MADSVRLVTGEGLLGTGVFLLRLRPVEDGRLEGEAWVLAAFMPLLPLGRVRLAPEGGAAPGAELYAVERRVSLQGNEVALGYVVGVAGLASVLGCFVMSYWSSGESSWLAAIRVLLGCVAPLALFGWLDQAVPRRRAVRRAKA